MSARKDGSGSTGESTEQMTGEQQDDVAERSVRFTAFATLGTIGTTQDLAQKVLSNVDGVDPELVAEETLCLVAVTSARAAEVGLRDNGAVARTVVPTLLDLPFSYRDYLVGGAVIEQKDTSLLDANEEVYRRLKKKQDFYTVQLPENQFPGRHTLMDKMELWMGRISPPNLPDSPKTRLEKLELVPALETHLKLVLAFGRRGQAPQR